MNSTPYLHHFFWSVWMLYCLPSMTSINNNFLQSGVFPSSYKSAIVTPLLKKPSLDPSDLKNYRPVSNLSFMSKILEKVVVSQLMSHLNRHYFSIISSLHIDLVTVLKLPFLKLSMTFFWQSMRVSCRFWYSLTYLQRLIPITCVWYSRHCAILVQILPH